MEDVNELCGLVQEIVSESHGALDEKVEPDTPLLVSGLLDSLTIMRIVARVEASTGISFPETSLVAANFRTPDSLWAAVEKARAAAGDGSPVT
ncbi:MULTISPECIES: acyl carrier protein [unclassified Streptomyces]|uniref:acyl carrier protein n=1 Tax=unclassified Streptomyces TaxID=2593676 RepID=UPI002362A0BB|nr:acyl carrier protein [Streptomyces sp. MMBL 11-1]